ncbi:MAG: WecB/TagA/CpsF family glycosyltransferase, partial [Methylotenera sp.]|nr:WecB/TagA/CpsF family glycosyltransferase [Methylotenera sp.]
MLSDSPVFVADFPVTETTHVNLAETVKERMANAKKTILFFANTNFIVKCRPLLNKMLSDDVIIVNDGIGMDIAAKLLYRRKFLTNLNGTDFTPYFFYANAIKPLRVFLLGGKAEVLDRAAYYLVHDLKQIVVGSCDGYEDINRPGLMQIINDAKPDVLLVAMGNPRQEQWILDHYQQLDVPFISGVGALFDFWAGDKPRAPDWIQKL